MAGSKAVPNGYILGFMEYTGSGYSWIETGLCPWPELQAEMFGEAVEKDFLSATQEGISI